MRVAAGQGQENILKALLLAHHRQDGLAGVRKQVKQLLAHIGSAFGGNFQLTDIALLFDHLHGKSFAVADALQRFERVERLEQPEDIKRELPWVRESLDPETGRTRLYVDCGAGRTPLAEVTRSAFGTRDDRGDFRALASDGALREVGIGFPPYHGLCRTTTLAVV